jgi:hypothetical protein
MTVDLPTMEEDHVEAAGVVFSARRGRHWTQRRWRATVDGDIGLTVFYRSAQPDPAESARGWYLEIDWPPYGPIWCAILANDLAAARERAAGSWLDYLRDAVEDHSAEPDFEARWGAKADDRQTTVMTPRLGADGSGNTPRRTIRVPDSEWDAAKEAADANGDNLSEVIRASLKRYVARNAKRGRVTNLMR